MKRIISTMMLGALSSSLFGQSSPTGAATDAVIDEQQGAEEYDIPQPTADAPTVRRFHEVLEELLAEFGHDVKTGQIKDLKNLSIRKAMVSDTLPRSYGNYVELLVAERIRENSRIRLISCLPCKSKTSRIADKQILITSPHTNVGEMNRAAEQLGIDYFMDIILVYHTTHMVMAFQVFNTETKELTWARTYNSETIRSRFQKLAVDYSQVIKARASDEYVPEWRYLVGFGGASIPNVVSGARESSMLSLHLRGTEKFNNRRSEFGLLASLNISTSALLSEYPSTTPDGFTETDTTETVTEVTPTPFTTALGLFGIYSHNFLAKVENYDRIRWGVNTAIGLHLATGYIAPAARFGVDLFLGKKFVVSSSAFYVTNANILINNEFVKTDGGAGGDVILSYSF
ncbi:hypothetical protein [Pseudobacteriovorax antillogorgiicola]|uniref:Uncharacterized protein n=1 Tax=Pseudobacteriovorax antillogorgiicola TaxID=1513793 RepID=A0A1Y6BNY7_9BACT|nr:hypothetical protein [Pseudobacteriovorax antillogorgiicola]TCS55365.1 hypothetical protein EDD56_10586 [Pseudobacteriovorax antillogorgiicola]SMF13503.1 hypothetical protein SAMN06296036_105238 [Pseudobacteriovorax antillogorgiicola]